MNNSNEDVETMKKYVKKVEILVISIFIVNLLTLLTVSAAFLFK